MNLETGVITILDSKGKKDRLVYLPPDGVDVISDYMSKMNEDLPQTPWMFPGNNPEKPISDRKASCRERVLSSECRSRWSPYH